MHLVLAVLPMLALANPHSLPFSYPYATLPKDGMEVEQYVDMTPVRDGTHLAPRGVLTTEFEYGLLDRLELGLYLQLENPPGGTSAGAPLALDGIKQRLRLRLAEAGEWPVDTSLYAEVSEFTTEVEVEGKVNLERRVGPLQFLANLWFEYEMYYDGNREWVLNPTAGVSYEIEPWLHVGAEYWMRAEFDVSGSNTGQRFWRHYVGPTALLQFKHLWWSAGVYARVDENAAVPDPTYGRVWVRTIIGIPF